MELMLPEIITFGNQCFGVIQSEEKTWLFTKKPYIMIGERMKDGKF